MDVEKLSSVVPRLSVDYIVDIESAFFYPNKEAFLREAHLVLKEDGTMFLAFFAPRTKWEQIHRWVNRYFDIVHEEDITDNVIRSLSLDTDRMSAYIDR